MRRGNGRGQSIRSNHERNGAVREKTISGKRIKVFVRERGRIWELRNSP